MRFRFSENLKDEKLPFGVEDQIRFAERLLMQHVKRLGAKSLNEDGGECRVILIGHSFSSYISLELMRRFRERLSEAQEGKHLRMRIIGAICLFRGILNIADSPRAKELMSIPFVVPLALTISFLLRWITCFLPTSFLAFPLCRFAELPKDGASTAAHFLQSKWGLKQALYMTQDELRVIINSKWDNEIWCAATPSRLSQPRPKLFILFGKDDQWMSDQVRDELIREKGRAWDSKEEVWKPVMEIEETGIPHDFCIRDGVKVAERVVEWVRVLLLLMLEGRSYFERNMSLRRRTYA
ncbi:uncharacterized protein PAC_05134 [Phialocephala subalpina]|uniref:AB hydrolase-1 domain-containing protein n=1 Tax=Phialocephala subalpina TaxID=576137 RepID=A0A1L7WR50_9HELO|nr:uncharacterized protein PAC_05134 [Phialocephala subalpina]